MKLAGRYLLFLLAFLPLVWGCENYFGKKTSTDFIEKPEFQAREVAYIPIQPILDGFGYPTDVHAGFDELIYVVDNATEEIISFDQALNELGRIQIQGVKKIAQDRNLDILAVGTIDTVDNTGATYTLPCIYRINQKQNGGYGLNNAKITSKIIHPFYFRNTIQPTKDPFVEFNSIAVLATNEFYVTRNGPFSNIVGPDEAVLLFSHNEERYTPINITSGGATFSDFFKQPFAITTQCQPPQVSASTSRTFAVTSVDQDEVLKVQIIEVVETEFGITYNPRETVISGDEAEDFLQRPFRFKRPEDITITGDGTNFIFMVDAETDSLYQFTFNGLEGVQPPPGSTQDQYIKASFGGTGTGANQFNEPKGVAYLDEIVYVADAANGRVLRFRLTLDFD